MHMRNVSRTRSSAKICATCALLMALLNATAYHVHAAEPSKSTSSEIQSLINDLNGVDRTKAINARRQLIRMPISELAVHASQLLGAMKVCDPLLDDAAWVVASWGPDSKPLIPIVMEAIGNEKNDKHRVVLVEVVGLFGQSARELVPNMSGLARTDPDPDVREAAARVAALLDVTDDQTKEAATALRCRKYENEAQREAVKRAVALVKEHAGYSVELIQELTSLEIGHRVEKELVSPNVVSFFRRSPWSARIGMAIVEKEITGNDEKNRAAALDLLCELADSKINWPAELAFERVLKATDDKTLMAVIPRLSKLDSVKDWEWVLRKLAVIANRSPYQSVRKTAETAMVDIVKR